MSKEIKVIVNNFWKLPFSKPGSGGSEPFSKLRDLNMIQKVKEVRNHNQKVEAGMITYLLVVRLEGELH